MVRKVSEFTKLGWYIGIIAILVELLLGITYFRSEDPIERYFGMATLFEAGFCFLGLLFIDVIYGNSNEISIKPKRFKRPPDNTLMVLALSFTSMVFTVFFGSYVLTIRDYEKAASIIFAAPCEEIFFRGFLLSIFIKLSENSAYKFKIGRREIAPGEIFGIFFQAAAFAAFHVNYYNQPGLLIGTFLNGIAQGIIYWYFRNLLANIGGHLAFNMFTSMQIFYMVSF